MYTTIQVTKQLRDTLENRKMAASESYEEVIWDLLEDSMELSEETGLGKVRDSNCRRKVQDANRNKEGTESVTACLTKSFFREGRTRIG